MTFFVGLLADGCKYVTQLLASLVSFDNSSTTLASTNVQDALVEIASLSGAAYQFSIQTVKAGETIIIPGCQQMVVHGCVNIADTGCYSIEPEGCIAIL